VAAWVEWAVHQDAEVWLEEWAARQVAEAWLVVKVVAVCQECQEPQADQEALEVQVAAVACRWAESHFRWDVAVWLDRWEQWAEEA